MYKTTLLSLSSVALLGGSGRICFRYLFHLFFFGFIQGKTMELRVSQDGGNVWNHAHFPVNLQQTELKQQERAELGYQILDASEGSVFINVDNDNGLGTAGGAHTVCLSVVLFVTCDVY